MALKKKVQFVFITRKQKKKKSADQVYGKKHCVKRPA